MGAMEEIRDLVRFEGRGPGSDAERRAARHLADRLQATGREAEIEPVEVWPRWPAAYALNGLVAIVGSVVAVSAPLVGAALVLAALVATFLDATGLLLTSRRLLGRRASQNVVSARDDGKPGTLVLVAHYDAGRGGAVFSRRLAERRAALSNLLRRPIGPLGPYAWAMLAVLVCAAIRIPGLEGRILTAIQFVPTVFLIVSLPLLADVALSGVVPGANDNASGVATVLRLAERFGGSLEHFDLWVLFTGANEAMSGGMRGFLRGRRKHLSKERTVFVNVDEVGFGTVRYTNREGPLVTVRSHVQLVQLCDDIAEDDRDHNAFGARRLVDRGSSDGYPARTAGFPSITVSCRGALDYTPTHHQPDDTAEGIEPEALERAYAFCSELVMRLDAEIGPELERSEEATLSEERA